ncbi:unnamed protein product [Blepharisma stoltei]|uniref:tRNA-binding domain-containing protein n=1 Tax=Blepharisma stoltei TaxID=1481888 RepID=A0AAU9JKN6_9CILI|nr:unnamed protein product [Blepharisma stoltei]
MARAREAIDLLIKKLENQLGVTEATLNENLRTPEEKALQSSAVETPQAAPKEEQKAEETPKTEETKTASKATESAASSHHEEEIKVNLAEAPLNLFNQIDIRVGRIVECWKHPSSEALYCEKIDLGEGNLREIGSGLQKHIPIEDMSGLVLVCANLKPRKLAGFNSNGMVFALHTPTGFELVRPPVGSAVGERVGIENIRAASNEPILPALNPKKKILEQCTPYLQTDGEGFASFGLNKLVTSAGVISSKHPNGHIS